MFYRLLSSRALHWKSCLDSRLTLNFVLTDYNWEWKVWESMSRASIFLLFSCNLFCIIQTFTSATHDCMLLIRVKMFMWHCWMNMHHYTKTCIIFHASQRLRQIVRQWKLKMLGEGGPCYIFIRFFLPWLILFTFLVNMLRNVNQTKFLRQRFHLSLSLIKWSPFTL